MSKTEVDFNLSFIFVLILNLLNWKLILFLDLFDQRNLLIFL